jgi:hypothetical protein
VALLTIDGPINSDKEHRQVQISVGGSDTEFRIMQGYEGHVLTTKTWQSNDAAFAVFLHALTLDGYTQGDADPKKSDERGYCQDGDRYIFEFNQGGDHMIRWWATTCNEGNYKGSRDKTIDLFQKQVPGYDELIANVAL